MSNKVLFIYIVLQVFSIADTVYGSGVHVELSSNGPVILGANIIFNAHLYNSDGSFPSGNFKYVWQDNSLWENLKEITVNSPSCFYNLSYSPKKYPPGPYMMQVEVYDSDFIIPWPWPLTSARLPFELTMLLNGQMQLVQGSQIQSGIYVASGEIKQEIVLSQPDFHYLNDTATSIRTLWFLDCNLIGNVTGYNITTNFTHSEESHTIEAIVVARFDPIPKPAPPIPPHNNSVTTTQKPTTIHTSSNLIKLITKRDVLSQNNFNPLNISHPFTCNNKSLIIPNSNETYGYFERNITVKAPIENVTISGNNWLQHDELLRLNVSCQGSAPIRYCLIFENGIKNATGNETCENPAPLDICKFQIYRFFRDEEQHTIFIILYNDVTKVVKPVAVTIYKAIHHPQLSVIVVPVSFSLVAVVLIVFGVAYYVQSRNRFIVEVADFDFAQQYAEMEYKTFSQRLGEAFSETFIGNLAYQYFNKDKHTPNGNASSSGFKYGSMT